MRSRRSVLAAVAAGSLAGCTQRRDPATEQAGDATGESAPGAAENGTDDRSDDEAADDSAADVSSPDGGEAETGGPAFEESSVGPLVDRFHLDPAIRPACDPQIETYELEIDGETRELRSVGTLDYPEPPATFTRETVLDYLAAHEEVFVQNDYVCGQSRPESVVGFSVGVSADRAEYFDWYEDVHVVRFDHVLSATHFSGEYGPSVADGAPRAGVYAADETAAVRVGTEGRQFVDAPVEAVTPDPVAEGHLVVRF